MNEGRDIFGIQRTRLLVIAALFGTFSLYNALVGGGVNIGRTLANGTTPAAVDDTLLLTTLFANSLVEASLTPIEQVHVGDRVLAELCDNYSSNLLPIHQRFGADHRQSSSVFAIACLGLPPLDSAVLTPSGETDRRVEAPGRSLRRSHRPGRRTAAIQPPLFAFV
jgi:hypothetical protein